MLMLIRWTPLGLVRSFVCSTDRPTDRPIREWVAQQSAETIERRIIKAQALARGYIQRRNFGKLGTYRRSFIHSFIRSIDGLCIAWVILSEAHRSHLMPFVWYLNSLGLSLLIYSETKQTAQPTHQRTARNRANLCLSHQASRQGIESIQSSE